jgi:hypothetical protein
MAGEKEKPFDDFAADLMGSPFLEMLCEIVPNLEEYRAKNVNKYYREKELPYSDYVKRERYKNRVRFVDTFLGPLRKYLERSGVLRAAENNEQDIP